MLHHDSSGMVAEGCTLHKVEYPRASGARRDEVQGPLAMTSARQPGWMPRQASQDTGSLQGLPRAIGLPACGAPVLVLRDELASSACAQHLEGLTGDQDLLVGGDHPG